MSCLFGGNSCTWVLILVIVFLLSQGCDLGCGNDSGNYGNRCGCGCGNDYDNHNHSCGCGC
ncbi:MAG: hypothetical protein E7554_08820 [Ruminococcaceae bacterium]|nr:hypothetical protein [Oscillospiraceae bacterium]